jgi:hypothetical protein
MLAQAQERLEGHFRALSKERIPLGFPVYAFEHGLATAEIDTIRSALCAELVRTRYLRKEHWLLWTVVAAEIGYTYDGEEYWLSFESEIPDWISYGDRNAVRDWFRDFTLRFTGFQPSGRWAEHFSIIAWPITHSILPRYLQSHFARLLYELRHDLAAKDNASIDQLGRLLGQRYHGDSSRFENFLQQTALTARLVLALRDEDVQDAIAPIYRPTLARIIADLERKGSSRGYLHDARRVMRDARVKSSLSPSGPVHGQGGPQTEVIKNAARGIKIIARRNSSDVWTINAALPPLPALLAQYGLSTAILDKVRMRFTDRPESWMPGRALLSYSGRDHPLRALPSQLDEPLIQFESSAPKILSFVSELKILSRSPWLLRIYEDGVARQVLGNHVRTGEQYLVVTSTPLAPIITEPLKLSARTCGTTGLCVYLLDAPSVANPQFLQALSKLTLGYSLRARVRPMGLVPRWESSIGASVWLSTEEVLLQLSADFEVCEFSVSINGQGKTRFPVHHKRELLVSLGTPPIGRHVVEIGATSVGNEHGGKLLRPISPETFFIEIRAPVPWQQGVQQQVGLRIVLEPPDCSFEDLLAKKALLEVHGPTERTAIIEAHLYDMAGHLSESAELGRIDLPSSERVLARAFDKLAVEPLSEKVQSAPRVELAFLVEELGAATISFPHKVSPLRWKLTVDANRRSIRLIDEAGAGAKVMVDRYNISLPDQRVEVDPQSCLHGVAVEAPGALFVARHDGKIFAAVASVPPREKLAAFSDLNVSSVLAKPGGESRQIIRFLAIMRLWRAGRPLGPLAVLRKTNVLGIFERQIELLACGSRWADRAQRYRSGAIAQIEDLQGEVGGSPGFASRMRTTNWTWLSDNAHARSEFFRLAKTYGISEDANLCDLALRLAFHPSSIRLDDPKKGAAEFEQLGTKGILARGAFFAKLTSDLRFRESGMQAGAPQ